MEKYQAIVVDRKAYRQWVDEDCILGASVALGVDTTHLSEAYQHFKEEVQRVKRTIPENREHG
jgi:hypothetical protein